MFSERTITKLTSFLSTYDICPSALIEEFSMKEYSKKRWEAVNGEWQKIASEPIFEGKFYVIESIHWLGQNNTITPQVVVFPKEGRHTVVDFFRHVARITGREAGDLPTDKYSIDQIIIEKGKSGVPTIGVYHR